MASCEPPEVTILNLPDSRSSSLSIQRSKDFVVLSNVGDFDCVSKSPEFMWRAYKYNMEVATLIGLNGTGVETISTELYIEKRTLPYGEYRVSFEAAMPDEGHSGLRSATGYFSIVQSPLEVEILGGYYISRNLGTVITLDGSSSRDPDVEPGEDAAMQFTWLCKSQDGYFIYENPPVITLDSGPGTGGCFGTGMGRLSSNNATALLDTSKMTTGNWYDVLLVVTKDNRKVDSMQGIQIMSDISPELSLTCLVNCYNIIVPTSPISLSTTCAGPACENARYEWSLSAYIDPNKLEFDEVPLTDEMTETTLNNPGIVIKPNQLRGNLTYGIKVFAYSDNGASGFAGHMFRTNIPPHSGQCAVAPTKGEALTTNFSFKCTGWQGSHLPLSYQFYYKTDHGMFTAVSKGSQDHVTTMLPAGKEVNNYQVDCKVLIIDSLSGTAMERLAVQVRPTASGRNLTELAVGENSGMNQLLKSGNVQAATQLANAVLETVNQANDTATEDRIAIRDHIIERVSRLQVYNLQSLTQMTSVIARATIEPKEVTFESQNVAVETLSSMTSVFSKKVKEDFAFNPTLVEEGGENLVLCLGNMLNSAAQKSSVLEETAKNEENQQKSKETVEVAKKLIDEVGTALLSSMIADQEPRKLKTQSLEMTLTRQSPRSLETISDLSGNVDIKISLDAITDHRAKHAQYIDGLLTTTMFNPYSWHSSASAISSHVIDLVFKDHHGNMLTIRESKKNIEIKISRELETGDKKDAPYFVKPTSEGKMQYHKVQVTDEGTKSVRLTIVPSHPTLLKIFIRYGKRPTTSKFDAMKNIPEEGCAVNAPDSCNEKAYSVFLSSDLISRQGTYFVGILYNDNSIESSPREKRSCSGKNREKRSCVEPKDPPTLNSVGSVVIPTYDPEKDLNYSLKATGETCLFWNKSAEQWSSQGCKAGPNTNSSAFHCLCTHLTSFGGGVVVIPNQLDFDVIYTEIKQLDETGNVLVLGAILAVLVLYLLVVIFSWKADKRDRTKGGPLFQLNAAQKESFQYELTIVTGVWKESGTDSNVAIVVYGTEAKSQPIVLNKHMIASRTILARGNEDAFVVNLPVSLGILRYVHIWHDNSGKSPSWFLDRVVIKDCRPEDNYVFVCNKWFAVEKGDGKIDRVILPASPREIKSFVYSLNSKRTKEFSDGHLWLSVVTKSPSSSFTRVQRATCCLCVLMSTMLVNAMFYGSDTKADPTIQVGPLSFSMRQFIVGVQSALIVTPVNLLIVGLFKKTKNSSQNLTSQRREKEYISERTNSSSHLNDDDTKISPKISEHEIQEVKTSKISIIVKCVAYLLCIIVVSVSSLVTFSYSLQWGKDIANQWLSSMFVSFTEDLLVLQPIKICLIMVLSAFLCRQETGEVISHKPGNHVTTADTKEASSDDLQRIKVEVPHEEELASARKYKIKEERAFSFSRDVFAHLFFLLLLMIVCYGNRSFHGFLMTKDLQDSLNDFPEASDPEGYWDWLEDQFLSAIYGEEWYNNQKVKAEEYIDNKKSILLGMPRLRQLRVQKDSCKPVKHAQAIFKSCYDFYSYSTEDKTQYFLPGWQPLNSSIRWEDLSQMCPVPWRYTSAESLQLLPSWGLFNMYYGGGYVAELGYNRAIASQVISSLRPHNWIDQQTRAVLVEFTIYNPSTGYLSISTYFYEMLPTGYGDTFVRIDTLPLTSTQTGLYEFYLICQFLFIIVVFFSLAHEVYKLYRQRCAYLRDMWNLIAFTQLVSSSLVVTFYLMKSRHILQSILQLRKNHFITVSFQEAVTWNEAENVVLAVTISLGTVKLLRLIRINPHVVFLMSSFRVSRGLLVSYSVFFLIIFLSYAQLGILVFGNDIPGYSSLLRTLVSEFMMCLGGSMELAELQVVNRIIGPLFGFSFVCLMSFIVVNFFVAILDESYEFARENVDKDSEEFELADFILEKLTGFFGFRGQQTNEESIECSMPSTSPASNSVSRTDRRKRPTESARSRQVKQESKGQPSKLYTEHSEDSAGSLRKEGKMKEQFDTGTRKRRSVSTTKDFASGQTQCVTNQQKLDKLVSLTSELVRDAEREDLELLSIVLKLRKDKDTCKDRDRLPRPKLQTWMNVKD